DRKSTRLNSSHVSNSYAVFCLKKKSRVAGRFDLIAPDEARGDPAHQRVGAPGPAEQPVDCAESLRRNRDAVDRLAEAGVARIAPRPGPGRYHERIRRVAGGDLAHHARDPAAERREIEREQEGRAQPAPSARRRSTASRYTASVRSAVRSRENSRRTRSRPARAIRCANARSPSTRA